MKVLISTYCLGNNYGALLQAWAMGRVVSGLGHDVRYLRYHQPWSFGGPYNSIAAWVGRSPASTLRKLSRNILNLRLRKCFRSMERRFEFTPVDYKTSVSAIMHTPPIADCYITGSDQVWTGDWKYSAPYFLPFGDDSVRRVAYAVSCGGGGFDLLAKDEIVKCLRRFSQISVREYDAVHALSNIGFDDVPVMPDPTLLLERTDYDSLASSSVPQKVTAFVYMLGEVSAERHCEIDKILDGSSINVRLQGFMSRRARNLFLTVEEFLGALSKSGFVITNSFHGTVFSILFHRPFVYLRFPQEEDRKNRRAETLLRELGLSWCMVNKVTKCPQVGSFDWGTVDFRLSELRKKGVSFLSEALKGLE